MEVRRKDGRTDLTLGKYGSGLIETKYGTYIADSLSTFGKTGAKIGWATDTVGITLKPEMLKLIKSLREKYKFKDASEIVNAVSKWCKCSCGFEGIPKEVYEEKTEKIGDVEKKEYVFVGFECPNKRKKDPKGHILEKTYPEAENIPLETLSTEEYEKYNKYDNNPTRNRIMIDRKVAIKTSEERRFNMKWFSLLLGVGLMLLLIFVGVSYMDSNSLFKDPQKLQTLCSTVIQCAECICP